MRRNDTIRVATFAAPGAAPVMRTVPWPQIPKKGALIQIGACGVCGTDLHILKGHVPTVIDGRVLGHEAVGTVEEVGPNRC
jgi:D-arabinose 1-dehydrogenase-like Zn-dependent alcohol dehydrogenase